MYYEHRKKEYEEARKIAEEGLVLSMGISSSFEGDFRHRLDRLKHKIKKQEEERPAKEKPSSKAKQPVKKKKPAKKKQAEKK
jgi:DNA polymerase II small subunit/DNA polymerase delta subunit B